MITSDNQNQLFLTYQLNSSVVLNQMEALIVGATFKRINVDQIRRFWITCPPFEEQMEIAEYLDYKSKKFDEVVNTIRQASDRLQEYRTALIAAAVTGKIDVRGEV